MKLLNATQDGNVLNLRIHTDETKVLPDPAYVREFAYTLDLSEEATTPIDQQIESAVREASLLVQADNPEPGAQQDLTEKLASLVPTSTSSLVPSPAELAQDPSRFQG